MANVKNFTYSTVAVAPSPATSGISLTVSSGDGALFVAGRPAVIYPSGEAPLTTNAEIVDVSNVVGDVLTIVREQESTSARTVIVGDQIAQVLTAAEYNALEAYIAALETGKLDTTAQAADVNPAGTAIAAALAAKLGTSDTAADVNPAGAAIAAALAGKLATSGTAADVNPAGTSIAAALAGKLATSGTAADVNPNGTSIAAALAEKTPASVVPGTLPNAGQLLIGNAGNTAYAPVTMSGDLTIAANGVSTLATVNGNVGSFGSATQVVGVTVNAKGQVTAANNITVTPAIGSVTGLGANVATALATNVGSAGGVVTNGGALGTPSSGTLTNCTGLPPAGLTTAAKTFKIGQTWDGGGSAIATGKGKGFIVCPVGATIVAWDMTADQGTPVVKVWKIAAGTAKPTSSNSINTSGVGLSSGTSVRSTTLTDFTSTTVTANDIFAFNLESNTGSATEITFEIELTRT